MPWQRVIINANGRLEKGEAFGSPNEMTKGKYSMYFETGKNPPLLCHRFSGELLKSFWLEPVEEIIWFDFIVI